MRKRLVAATVIAALGLGAGTASAQGYTVTMDWQGTRAVSALNSGQSSRNGARGGGFNYNITAGNTAELGSSLIAYCFGPDQYIQDPAKYRVMTFAEFTGWSSRPSTYNTITTQDLNDMAYLVTTYTTGAATVANGTTQERIWQIAVDGTQAVNTGVDFSSGFRVMIDDRFLTQKDFRFSAATQPFLAQVPGGSIVTPEPSTYVLMAAGLAGLAVVSRRRRLS